MKRKVQAAVVAAAVILIAAVVCIRGNHQKINRYQGQIFDVFDTVTEVIGYAGSEEEFSDQIKQLQEKLQYYHKLYDIYHDYEGINNIKTINDNAGIQPVKVDPEIINLLKLGQDMYDRTNGQINIAYGSVLRVWHEYREEGIAEPEHAKVPDMELLKEKAEHTDIRQLVIDEENSTVYLTDPEMSLDVGSIGKGYAVQKTAEYAREEMGIEHLSLSVGGNICVIGGRIDGEPWKIGIQNPKAESGLWDSAGTSTEAYVKVVGLTDKCIVTSGNYQRYYEVDGTRYCHIIDPDTNMPADYFDSVSIICEDSGLADALSTSVYNMEFTEGLALIEALTDVEAMWILSDGSIAYSSGFEEYLE